MAASLSPDTNVEWCKIKAQTFTSNPITAEKFLSASQLWNHMRFSSTSFSQTKIHLFVLENTVDPLCKPYRWILSLCTVQRIARARGSTFPRYYEKDIHCSNYPLPLCSSGKHNRCHCQWNQSNGGVSDDRGKNLIATTPPPPPPPPPHTQTRIHALQCAKQKKKRCRMPQESGEMGMTSKMFLWDIFSIYQF